MLAPGLIDAAKATSTPLSTKRRAAQGEDGERQREPAQRRPDERVEHGGDDAP